MADRMKVPAMKAPRGHNDSPRSVLQCSLGLHSYKPARWSDALYSCSVCGKVIR